MVVVQSAVFLIVCGCRLEEAIAHYESSGVQELAATARLKLGHYLITSPVAGVGASGSGDDRGVGSGGAPLECRRGDALLRAGAHVTAAANVLFVDPQFKLAILLEATVLFLKAACKRKAALYTMQVCHDRWHGPPLYCCIARDFVRRLARCCRSWGFR